MTLQLDEVKPACNRAPCAFDVSIKEEGVDDGLFRIVRLNYYCDKKTIVKNKKFVSSGLQ